MPTAEERKADHADRERLTREKRVRDDGLQKGDTSWGESMKYRKRQALTT
tara:strand:- start:101 stop:250 length:150 start_codon:yes stop_codon:yes gene_type:complete